MNKKEISIEEKARRYDEALAKARNIVNSINVGLIEKDSFEAVFPELKENGDERIRKAIVKMMSDIDGGSPFEKYGIIKKEALAWLEKQAKNNMGISEATKKKLEDNLNKALEKETPESCNEFLEKQGGKKETLKERNICDTCEDSNGCLIPCCAKLLEKQGEQKPVEWRPSKEVMDVLYSLCYVSDIMDEHKDTVLTKLYQELKREYFNSASYENMFPKEEKIKQSLTKWNEEDDKKLSSIIDLTNYAQDTWSKKYMIEVRDWLKSIKDRCLPQPKPEYSKEDETVRNDIIAKLAILKSRAVDGGAEKEICEMEINWLKSLRPQSTWKPSDEQMDALRYVTNFDYGGYKATLVSLYEQLKKLRGE